MTDRAQPAPRGSRAGAAADETVWERFVAFLKTEDGRVTFARRAVFDEVMARHDHFRADDLAAELARRRDRVSRGTVYRTLALLVKSGLVRAIRDGDTHFHYEHTHGHSHHEHLVCELCGAFVEFQAPEIERAIAQRCREQQFAPRTHRLTVLGTCHRCASAPGGGKTNAKEKEQKK